MRSIARDAELALYVSKNMLLYLNGKVSSVCKIFYFFLRKLKKNLIGQLFFELFLYLYYIIS